MTEMTRARELDPLSLIINTNLGRIFYFQRRYDAAIEQYERTLRIEPEFGGALWKLWHAQERAGRTEKAFAALESWAKSTGAEDLVEVLRRAYRERGYTGALRGLLDRFPASGRVDPYNLALIYAKLGEKSAAFKWLDQACREHSGEIVYLDVEPIFDAIRSDARFTGIRTCVGLTAASPATRAASR